MLCPELFVRWAKAVNEKDWDKAAEIQKKVDILMELFDISAPFLTAVKRALKISGEIENEYGRAPLVLASEEEEQKIRELMRKID